MHQTTVAVIGGGLTGLVAARRLARNGCRVQIFESSQHLGGQIHPIATPEGPVDAGAESIHLGAPAMAQLVTELGLAESVIGARAGTSLLLDGTELVPLPAGVTPTGPTRIRPVLSSGLLSPVATARAGLEPLMAVRRRTRDVSVGEFISARFGRAVADTFVDPLLGNLHGGDIYQLSQRATAPQLTPVAESGTSLLIRAMRLAKKQTAAPTAQGKFPMFASWPDGLSTLVESLRADLRKYGVSIHYSSQVNSIEPQTHGWLVNVGDSEFRADHVVVTSNAPSIRSLVGQFSPTTKSAMNRVKLASVATVVVGIPRQDALKNRALADYNGLLLNSQQSTTFKAMTNLSRKWSSLDGRRSHVLRLSVGRSGSDIVPNSSDDELIAGCMKQLSDLINLKTTPNFACVQRWPQAMPQLLVNHPTRVAQAREELAKAPGLHIAGSSVDGLGLSNAISSGDKVAEAILANNRHASAESLGV